MNIQQRKGSCKRFLQVWDLVGHGVRAGKEGEEESLAKHARSAMKDMGKSVKSRSWAVVDQKAIQRKKCDCVKLVC